MANMIPASSSIEELRTLYEELSAKREPYYKTLIRIWYPKKEFVEETVVHSRKEHVDLSPKNHPGCIRVECISSTTEWTMGGLYCAGVSTQRGVISSEWALIFKIDCDLARQKTGSIDAALVHYINKQTAEEDTPVSERIRRDREKLERVRRAREMAARASKEWRGGRYKETTNSVDLLQRYGRKSLDGKYDTSDAATAWILANAKTLDEDESFTYDKYRSSVDAHKHPRPPQDYGWIRGKMMVWEEMTGAEWASKKKEE